jgi:hypothetical protein
MTYQQDPERPPTRRPTSINRDGEGWGFIPIILAAALVLFLGYLVFGPDTEGTTRQSNVRTEGPTNTNGATKTVPTTPAPSNAPAPSAPAPGNTPSPTSK